MSIEVALHHKTSYHYSHPVTLYPQVVRLRPAPHCRTRILSYSLNVSPEDHFVNWQQDPHGNFLARLVFHEKVQHFEVEVDLVADMTVVNPFEFFLEESAEYYPFEYAEMFAGELASFRRCDYVGPHLAEYLSGIDRSRVKTIDFLVALNQHLQQHIGYVIRMEPGVQTPEETLQKRKGSCRDSAWLQVQILRNLGLAARFVSGYLIQLAPDIKPVDGPPGPSEDFTDLHAWTEVYLPGAGWIGLDPTSGLLAGEGHIPLASSPDPIGAAPIDGGVEPCETEFNFEMSVTRVRETPRVTKPYSEEQWQRIVEAGRIVDEKLRAGDVRLTMGGEPTFVAVDDMEGAEWNEAAVGPTKKGYADRLIRRLKDIYATGGFLHFGQGKWYPGESLPRWALGCFWLRSGEAIWRNPDLIAETGVDYGHDIDLAKSFTAGLADRLGVDAAYARPGFEDVFYYLWREKRLAVNVDPFESNLSDKEERERLAKIFTQGLDSQVGCVLPIAKQTAGDKAWVSGVWPVRDDRLFLIPGDSPMGLRLPLEALPWVPKDKRPIVSEADPFEVRQPFSMEELRSRMEERRPETARVAQHALVGSGPEQQSSSGIGGNGAGGQGNGHRQYPWQSDSAEFQSAAIDAAGVVRTALCVEPREGALHVFMPPVEHLEDYLELLTAIEQTADQFDAPVFIEGYLPPFDPRLRHLSVTPDPGVIEVNIHPAESWDEIVENTELLYEEARQIGLGTEKFDKDGKHTGTGGGNHLVLGAATPADSPFLRRPDLLKSLLGYWQNHPSLSYLFSGKFIGPTSQAPRADEGRNDSIYELKIAFEQIPIGKDVPPWLVDRVFRHLLTDLTGNTHRAEFCIDKLFAPESASGRKGLVELRAFEMPPHARMSCAQQLLLRSLIAKFWEEPFKDELVSWGTQLHDRYMLLHFVALDMEDVIRDVQAHGIPIDLDWFYTHFEFRFPKIGEFTQRSVNVELRQAIEPWYVLGEEPMAGGTARYVDSSCERLEVKVRGLTQPRYLLTCNGRQLPLHPTGTVGEYVAAVRYRAWQPPSCLHPTIPVDTPLVFDLVDTWSERSLGGCQYHVGHPGGLNPESFPINANEAESRRGSRFFAMGHTPGKVTVRPPAANEEFPLTLDLRKNRSLE